MSRKSRRRRSEDPSVFPTAISIRSLAPLVRDSLFDRLDFRPVEDRRTYHPLAAARPARIVTGHPVRRHVVRPAVKYRSPFFPSSRIRFAVPKRTLICIRRKTRREVLHALSKVGRGRGSGRKRRNYHSEVTC